MSFKIARSRLGNGNEQLDHWKNTYGPADKVPVSGIYFCTNCNREVTCNKDDPFPPQNRAQHPCDKSIKWKLNIMANTNPAK